MSKAANNNAVIYALAGSLLYLSHPALIESTAWIAAQFDIFLSFFLLLLILSDLLTKKVWSKFGLAFALYLLAAMSKETAAPFLFVIILFHLFVDSNGMGESVGRIGGRVATYSGILLGGVAYLILRYSALGYLMAADHQTGDVQIDPLLLGKVLYHYLQIVVVPFFTISPVHELSAEGDISDLGAWLAIILALCATILVILRKSRAAVLFLVFIVSLLPALNVVLIPSKASMLSDRYLTFPLALLFIMLAVYVNGAVDKQQVSSKLPGYLAVAWLSCASVAVFSYTKNWRNDLSLWHWAYQRQPDSTLVMSNYAGALLSYGYFEQAWVVADRLFEKQPHGAAAINLAKIYLLTGEKGLARDYFELAGEYPLVENSRVLRLTGLATVSLMDKDYARAKKYLMKALAIRPHDKSAVLYYGYTMYLQGMREDAVRYVKAHAVGIEKPPYREFDYLFGDEIFLGLIKQT